MLRMIEVKCDFLSIDVLKMQENKFKKNTILLHIRIFTLNGTFPQMCNLITHCPISYVKLISDNIFKFCSACMHKLLNSDL